MPLEPTIDPVEPIDGKTPDEVLAARRDLMLADFKKHEIEKFITIKQSEPSLFAIKEAEINAVTLEDIDKKNARVSALTHWFNEQAEERQAQLRIDAIAFGRKLGLSNTEIAQVQFIGQIPEGV